MTFPVAVCKSCLLCKARWLVCTYGEHLICTIAKKCLWYRPRSLCVRVCVCVVIGWVFCILCTLRLLPGGLQNLAWVYALRLVQLAAQAIAHKIDSLQHVGAVIVKRKGLAIFIYLITVSGYKQAKLLSCKTWWRKQGSCALFPICFTSRNWGLKNLDNWLYFSCLANDSPLWPVAVFHGHMTMICNFFLLVSSRKCPFAKGSHYEQSNLLNDCCKEC